MEKKLKTELDFLNEINKKSLDASYSLKELKKLLSELNNYLDSENIVLKISPRKEDSIFVNGNFTDNQDIILFILENNASLLICNMKKELEDEETFYSFLRTILNNIVHNYLVFKYLTKELYTDKLTGVLNRSAYEKEIKERKFYTNVDVAFIDANGLGIINNMYGYEEGDKLLKTVSGCIKNNFRNQDIYRFGGDEFVVICPNMDRDLFNNRINKCRNDILKTPYTASFGTIYENETNDIESLVLKASNIMKQEKERHRELHPELYPDKYKVKCKKLN